MEDAATLYQFHAAVKSPLFVLNTNEIARVSLSSSMDKFATLEPVKLYSSHNNKTLSLPPPLVGRLPSDLHLLILRYLPIPDFSSYSRCSHSTAALAQSDVIWQERYNALSIETYALHAVLDHLERQLSERNAQSRAAAPPTIVVADNPNDDFGDFAKADLLAPPHPPEEMGDFIGAFPSPPTYLPRSRQSWQRRLWRFCKSRQLMLRERCP